MTPGSTDSRTGGTTTTPQRKVHAVSFSRTTSADDEEWVDPVPIPTTPLDATPPLFPSTTASTSGGAGSPPIMVKAKSSSSLKGRKRTEARVPLPFLSSQAEGTDDRPRCVPQMSAARGVMADGRRAGS